MCTAVCLDAIPSQRSFCHNSNAENDVADDADVSVCSDAAEAADELLALDEDTNVIESSMASELPPSSQWMALLHDKFRPFGKVLGNVEWEYFKDNISKFQGGKGNEADNYCSIQFSAMAESWNKWVDSLGTRYPEVTYKTAAYLKDAYKSMKRRAVESATIRPHVHTLNKLKEMHTNEDTNRSFDRDFPQNERAAQIQPTFFESDANTIRSPTQSIHEETNLQNDDNDNYLADSEAKKGCEKRKHSKIQRSKHRCRRCGKCYSLKEWKPYHENNVPSEDDWGNQRPQSRCLRHKDGNKVWDFCTVDPIDFEEGFPCLDPSKRMPPHCKKVKVD